MLNVMSFTERWLTVICMLTVSNVCVEFPCLSHYSFWCVEADEAWRNVLGVVEEYWSVAIILKNRCPSALLPLLLISRTKAGLHYTAGDWTRYIRRNKTILVCVCVCFQWCWGGRGVCQVVWEIVRWQVWSPQQSVYEDAHIRVFINTEKCVCIHVRDTRNWNCTGTYEKATVPAL